MTAADTTEIITEKYPTVFRKCEETATRNEKRKTYAPAAEYLSAKNQKTQYVPHVLINSINTIPAVRGLKNLKTSKNQHRIT